MMSKTIVVITLLMLAFLNIGGCEGKDGTPFIDFFFAFARNVTLNQGENPDPSVPNANFLKYEEVLLNTDFRPFKVLYRDERFIGEQIGEIVSERDFDITGRFGSDVIGPLSELSRDNAFFASNSELGEITVHEVYCGHRVNDDGRPITNDGQVVNVITDGQLTCSSYFLTVILN